ncbi:MAG: phosphatase PAP2 family protein [Novosphingobium aromaticivorans]|nr:phosphatase PAP2 family protein [Novosphingobium aromaticivorans]
MANVSFTIDAGHAPRSLAQRLYGWRPSAHEVPILLTIALFTMIIAGAVTAGWFNFSHASLDGLIMSFLALWGLGHRIQSRGAVPGIVPGICKLFATFLGLALTSSLSCAVLARTGLPFVDATLARIDQHLIPGFSWPALVHALAQWPLALHALSYAYTSLGWQPLVLMAVFCCQGRERQAWMFINVWALCILTTTLLFAFTPALDPYTYFAIPHAAVPDVLCDAAWDAPALITQLRSHAITTLSTAALGGLVTFPSFHAAGAVILAWGYGKIRFVRWPFQGLNAIMWVSAVPIGGHYLIDLIAGTGLALLVIAIAERKASTLPAQPQKRGPEGPFFCR